MPDLNGIEATRQILRTSPHIGIIVLTMFQDDDFGVRGDARRRARVCLEGR